MRTALVVLLVATLIPACVTDREPSRGTLDERVARAIVPSPPFDPLGPFDTRLARLRPEAHVGQERFCDVVFVGTNAAMNRRIAGRYAERYAARNLIRCAALSGESWADLVYSEAARAFVRAVVPGVRLKVRVLAADGGFEDATVLEFLAVVEGAVAVTPARDTSQSVSAGFDFSRARRDERLVGQRRVCAIQYVGPIRRVTREDADLFPRGTTHHGAVLCHHALGDAWVETLFSQRTAFSALELERGRRITMEIRAASSGPAEHPFVVLAAQGPSGPRPAI